MKIHFLVLLLIASLWACDPRQSPSKNNNDGDSIIKIIENDNTPAKTTSIPLYARKLIEAYPDANIQYHNNTITVNGEQITYDDKKQKTFTELLDNCDIEDMFTMPYNTTTSTPAYLSDPGRARCEALFKAIYGHNAKEVAANLTTVNWFGQQLRFTTINNANRQLEKVAAELGANPQWNRYFRQSSTFYWRNVRGANRLSAHSYGMAIDINVANSDYWLWANPHATETERIAYKNRIPIQIVRIFERHGFIWGGRWYHFDTMHFEYRPELPI